MTGGRMGLDLVVRADADAAVADVHAAVAERERGVR